MRILWVKMGGLWPSTTGGRVRSLRSISELTRRHEVTVITTHGPGDDPEGLARRLSALPATSCRSPTSRRSAGAPRFRPRSRGRGSRAIRWISASGRCREVRQQVEQLIRRAARSICASPTFCSRRSTSRSGGTVPTVLFEHNVEYLIWQRLCALETNPVRRALFEIEWRKLRAQEAAACRRADLTIAVSEDDRERLEAHRARHSRRVDPDRRRHDVLHAEWLPRSAGASGVQRVDGLASQRRRGAALCRRDPAAHSRRGAGCLLHGRRPQPDRARSRAGRAQPGIFVTGTVDDVRPSIAEGCRLRRAAARRRRNAAEDFRGAGHGQAGGLDDRRRRRTRPRVWAPLHRGGRARRFRARGRVAAARPRSGGTRSDAPAAISSKPAIRGRLSARDSKNSANRW